MLRTILVQSGEYMHGMAWHGMAYSWSGNLAFGSGLPLGKIICGIVHRGVTTNELAMLGAYTYTFDHLAMEFTRLSGKRQFQTHSLATKLILHTAHAFVKKCGLCHFTDTYFGVFFEEI